VQVTVLEQKIDAVRLGRNWIINSRRDYFCAGYRQFVSADASRFFADGAGYGKRRFLAEAF